MAGPAMAGDGTFTHIGSPVDRIDISGYLQACSNTPNVPEQDKVAHFSDAGGMEYNFSWKCSAGRLFMTDGEFGYEFKCDGSAGGCHGATWRQINPPNALPPAQEPPSPLAPAAAALPSPFSALLAPPPPTPPAAHLPREALMAYCAAAGDTMPAVFGDGRTGPPIVWRCVKSAVYTCEAGADGVACSARSRSRVPSSSMVKSCREYGQLSVADGAYGYVWRWECQNREPVIVGPAQVWGAKPTKFDGQGYAEEEWSPIR